MSLDWEHIRLDPLVSEGPVAFSPDLGPTSLLAAYRAGFYPFPATSFEEALVNEVRYAADVAAGRIIVDETPEPYRAAWLSPDPRPVVDVQAKRPGRTIRRLARDRQRWRSTVDRCFTQVIAECAAGRSETWISAELRATMSELHADGVAHSVEIWDGSELIGGAFGVQLGAVFSADSQFTKTSGAGKVAVADLMARFSEASGRLLDCQSSGVHAANLGATNIARDTYLRRLMELREEPTSLPLDTRPVDHLTRVRVT